MTKTAKDRWVEIGSLIALLLGIVLGLLLPEISAHFSFVGRIFLLLLKVLILPIIIVSLFLAFAKMSSAAKLGSLGWRTVVYYFFSTCLAVIIGLILANIFIFSGGSSGHELIEGRESTDFVTRLLSDNIFQSLADGEILHIVIFTILFGLAFVNVQHDTKHQLTNLAEVSFEVLMRMIHWVLLLAPLGILSLVWSTIGDMDMSDFSQLGKFFLATAIAALVHALISLPLLGRFLGRFDAWSYFLRVKQALIISLATASSAATLPISTKVVEDDGVSEEVSRFVLPLGATLNMDGSALYQALLTMLFVNLAGMDITLGQQILVFVFIVLSSAGTAGVPSGGIVMMTMVIELLGIPNGEYYLGLYILVDRFWDYPITSINVWSDLVGAKTVDQWLNRSYEET